MDSSCASDSGASGRRRVRWAGGFAPHIVAGALVLSFVLRSTWLDAAPVFCATRRMFGIPCPGCGLTHSWVAAAHGDFVEAFSAHPFGPLLMLAAATWLVLRLLRVQVRPWPVRLERSFGLAFLVTFLAFGVWRAGATAFAVL